MFSHQRGLDSSKRPEGGSEGRGSSGSGRMSKTATLRQSMWGMFEDDVYEEGRRGPEFLFDIGRCLRRLARSISLASFSISTHTL